MVQIGNLRYDNIIRFDNLDVHDCCNEAEAIALKRRSGVKGILSCATCPQNFAARPTANFIAGLRTDLPVLFQQESLLFADFGSSLH
jgi:hypothetical protein